MDIKTSKRLKGIGEYYFSAKLREIEELNRAGKNVINLGIGSPDLPPHRDVIDTLHKTSLSPGNHSYQSYKGSPALRKAIGEWYHRNYSVQLDPESEILPLIGSKEGIMHICMTYLQKGDKALVPDPGYPTYSSAVKLAGAEPVTYCLKEKNGFLPNLDKLGKKNLRGVKMMFINYPHMPTGAMANPGFFEQVIAFGNKNGILIVHDNPYSFILNDQPLSILSVKDAMHTAIELNSLSKSHNMAGWRIGMLCGAAGRINDVLRFKSNMDSGMFLPVQLAAVTALSLGKEWTRDLNKVYRKRKEKVEVLMNKLGLQFNNQQAGLFMWGRVPKKYRDGFDFSDEILKDHSVFITPGGIFGKEGKQFARISLCAKEEKLDEAIDRISKPL
jgi:LL-diaminopimelate aminotransferase